MVIELSVDERLKIVEENTWFADQAQKAKEEKKEWQTFNEGHGIYLRDTEGKEYIDAMSGQFCVSLGHGNKKVIKAAQEQMEMVQYTLALRTDASMRLCQRIAELTPGDLNRVYVGLSGADANEAVLSTVKSYFRIQGKSNSMVIARWLGYHGQTLGAVAVTAVMKNLHGRDLGSVNQGVYHIFPPYCYRCYYGLEYPSCGLRCAHAFEDVVNFMGPENVAAFMGEPIMSNAGAIVPPDEYWPIMREICDKYGILLVLDEVITGWGRTGKLFACEHWNVLPDIMVMSKAITGGYLPLSAVVVREHVYQAFAERKMHFPYMGHTQSFYPAGAACALATIDVITEERLPENAAKVGAHIKDRLEKICQQSEIVGTIHGTGLNLGVEIVEDKKSKVPSARAANIITRGCKDKGVLIMALPLHGVGERHPANANMLTISPPLIITEDEADKLCDVLEEVIKKTEAARKKRK